MHVQQLDTHVHMYCTAVQLHQSSSSKLCAEARTRQDQSAIEFRSRRHSARHRIQSGHSLKPYSAVSSAQISELCLSVLAPHIAGTRTNRQLYCSIVSLCSAQPLSALPLDLAAPVHACSIRSRRRGNVCHGIMKHSSFESAQTCASPSRMRRPLSGNGAATREERLQRLYEHVAGCRRIPRRRWAWLERGGL